ncbi:hypothetical protein GCG21_08885 [Pseudactinotalea sp. HY160]|uniref:hypothetical protein n=1 Tax=Pseudactinotalea sp. HY160 TaxID=2654490 RepID=UPI00128E53D6|nr:hypothetical protein [Pseudactinotalea sp. HY160]MPV50119.1 hypothetical protein [Pseudactinotalea sp. HY160]
MSTNTDLPRTHQSRVDRSLADRPLAERVEWAADAQSGGVRGEVAALLPNISADTFEAAWSSITYLNVRELAAWDGEDIDAGDDKAALVADDLAREAANDVGREDAWEDEYLLRLREFYIDELRAWKGLLCKQLTEVNDGGQVAPHEPVSAGLPVVRFARVWVPAIAA